MTIEAPPTMKESPSPPPGRKAKQPELVMKPQGIIRAWIAYRTAQLDYENKSAVYSPIGGGAVNRGERQKVIAVFQDELSRFADWLDQDSMEFIPPMTADQKQQWRFARDHGADVPAHILAQLDVTA